jgi:hypothetical protein
MAGGAVAREVGDRTGGHELTRPPIGARYTSRP